MPQTTDRNRRFVLASRPEGAPAPDDFRLEREPVPEPGDGQVLLRTVFLSLDPYMRGRMSDAPSYADPVAIGGLMVGGTVCRVEASRHPDYAAGDWVLAYTGWQDYAISDGSGLNKLDPARREPLLGAGHPRHARLHRLHGPDRHRPAQGRRDRGRSPPPPAPSARWSGRSPSSWAAAWSASPAARRSAPT